VDYLHLHRKWKFGSCRCVDPLYEQKAMADAYLTRILAAVDANGCVEDSATLAKDMGLDHKVLVGCIKSLEASESIVTEVRL
jgi:hypothetical protein